MTEERQRQVPPPPGPGKTPEEGSEAAADAEEEVRRIPPAPGAPMQHGENR